MQKFEPVILTLLSKRLVHRYYLHPTDTLHRYFLFPLAYAILQLGTAVLNALQANSILISILVLLKIAIGLTFFASCFCLFSSLIDESNHECDLCNRQLNLDNFGRIKIHRYALPFIAAATSLLGFAVLAFPSYPIKTIADTGPYLQAILLNFPMMFLAGCGFLARLEFEFAVATDPDLDTETLKGCSKSQLLHIADLCDEFSNHANAITIELMAEGKKITPN